MNDLNRPFERGVLKSSDAGPIVAYDFETTNVPEVRDFGSDTGYALTVYPRYFTAFGPGIFVSQPLVEYTDVRTLLERLWPDLENKTRMVAFNGNRFDLRIVMYALLGSGMKVEPFVAKGMGLRGACVRYKRKTIYFYDTLAMLGLQCKLEDFLSVFAPNHKKESLDFSVTSFNARDVSHVKYAEQDARALWYGMTAAEKVVRAITHRPLGATIGALGIRAFCDRMPKGRKVYRAPKVAEHQLRQTVMRGGFCFARKFKGRVWTYDLNQAYAAAMRDCALPAGRCYATSTFLGSEPAIYCVTLARESPSPVPYPVRDQQGLTVWVDGSVPTRTWVTNLEVLMLRDLGWTVDTHGGYAWAQSFKMTRFVDALEKRRRHFDKTHPVNVVCKSIGNNAYGKTLQTATGWRYVMSDKQPSVNGVKAQQMFDALTAQEIPGFWQVRETRLQGRCYERPQLGAFITAHIRCIIYRTIMNDPAAFVKADTDGVSFSRPQKHLPISSWQYGLWKIESDGDLHTVVAKKVYFAKGHATAKGMNIRDRKGNELFTQSDFDRWMEGDVPHQTQVQLLGWRKGVRPTWVVRTRKGTNPE